ncbi:hypothetical protein P7K49_023454 [Saguinus oedipus]|uniref:Uncharacterized protein n=1 Tax=Saguinus oedipus TaxID=9490 RepID=A0ABQ9UNA2_SAGOE|nr:hypothetical protein P7K49_023454 [Saguinus oedipus]
MGISILLVGSVILLIICMTWRLPNCRLVGQNSATDTHKESPKFLESEHLTGGKKGAQRGRPGGGANRWTSRQRSGAWRRAPGIRDSHARPRTPTHLRRRPGEPSSSETESDFYEEMEVSCSTDCSTGNAEYQHSKGSFSEALVGSPNGGRETPKSNGGGGGGSQGTLACSASD